MKKKLSKEFKVGAGILSIYAFWAFSWLFYGLFLKGDFLTLYTPAIDITRELLSPLSDSFLLGTDQFGRPLLEVISAGLIYSIAVALTVGLTCATIGILMGLMMATGRPFIKYAFDSFTNLIFVFPSILIAIMVMSVVGESFWGLVFALVITGWPGYARIARGEILRVMGLSYVESAKAVGMGQIRLFLSIIIPAIFPVMLVHFVLGLGGVIISEAALGFLGLGGSPFSWGALLGLAKNVILEAPHMVVFISIAMAGLIIGLNLCGDGLRDYLDPQD